MVNEMVFNNNGFGLKQFILYGAILMVALFFVSFFASQLSLEFGDVFRNSVTSSNTYSSLESDLSKSALIYMDEYYKSEIGLGTITVTTDNLIRYGIMRDADLEIGAKDSCKGYVLVKKEKENSLKADAYIKCSKYETLNYQSWRLGE